VKSFDVDQGTPAEFIDRVRRELADRGLNQYVSLDGDEAELLVRFHWMGSTEIRYRLESRDDGFRAVLSGERVSPLHAAFRQRFDDHLDHILAKVGAKTI
jgi:hypothetical protein